jgi:hypothetical protein
MGVLLQYARDKSSDFFVQGGTLSGSCADLRAAFLTKATTFFGGSPHPPSQLYLKIALSGCVPDLFGAFIFYYHSLRPQSCSPSRSYLTAGCVAVPLVLSETMAEVVAVDEPPESRAIQRRKF